MFGKNLCGEAGSALREEIDVGLDDAGPGVGAAYELGARAAKTIAEGRIVHKQLADLRELGAAAVGETGARTARHTRKHRRARIDDPGPSGGPRLERHE